MYTLCNKSALSSSCLYLCGGVYLRNRSGTPDGIKFFSGFIIINKFLIVNKMGYKLNFL